MKQECLICGEPSVYECPACSVYTCSIACVKFHKSKYECTGRKCMFTAIPKDKMNIKMLRRDIVVLENASNIVESSARYRIDELGAAHVNSMDKLMKTSLSGKLLQKEADSRNITLIVCPNGLDMRLSNTSGFLNIRRNGKNKILGWRIHWIFDSLETPLTLVDSRKSELSTIRYIFDSMTADRWKPAGSKEPVPLSTKLAKYIENVNDIEVYLEVPTQISKSNKRTFYKICIEKTIAENLQFKSILEHPVIHFGLRDTAVKYPCLIEESQRLDLNNSDTNNTDIVD